MLDLPPACRWLDSSDGASYLYWNASCIATVTPHAGRWALRLEWQGRVRRGEDSSLGNAKARIERFVSLQPGLPRKARR